MRYEDTVRESGGHRTLHRQPAALIEPRSGVAVSGWRSRASVSFAFSSRNTTSAEVSTEAISSTIPDVVGRNPELAAWLISRRAQIEKSMCTRLGPAAPDAGAAESEVLRRFRMFAASALQRGAPPQPSLDGLRINERRAFALLAAWIEAAEDVAGKKGEAIKSALEPLLQEFRTSVRSTGTGRRRSGAPRTNRRVVMAAIDRVAASFFVPSGHRHFVKRSFS